MIPAETIDRIFDAIRIEEVVGEFVPLKKRGANLLGLCPFHTEKTPSFSVSPSKGIYKCFGCGAGGNAVQFLMEHEHLNYPEALRYAAKKYGIEVEEKEMTPEMKEVQSKRESLYVVMEFAEKWFHHQLLETDEGRSVGVAYFSDRGIDEHAIKTFRLGYSSSDNDAFLNAAREAGHNDELLMEAGLIKQRNELFFDAYKGRVIFPIYNLSGRTVGFGGRTLSTNKKIPKYVNTPECAIYHKSQVLYGLYQARQEIARADKTYLVEGYTDVISMHLAGVRNVVASSGTSLTEDQIRLARRFSSNISIIYDGDSAGIKAAFRGIDMIIKAGMNVRIIPLPESDDPDSLARRLGPDDTQKYLDEKEQDFVIYLTSQLLGESGNDPLKKAKVVRQIVATIALVPDAILRSFYTRECGRLLDVEEGILYTELRKLLRKGGQKNRGKEARDVKEKAQAGQQEPELADDEPQERDVIRMMLKYSGSDIEIRVKDKEEKTMAIKASVPAIFVRELAYLDEIEFSVPVYQKIFDVFKTSLSTDNNAPDNDFFVRHEDPRIASSAATLLSDKYLLHQWGRRNVIVKTEAMRLHKTVFKAIHALKLKKLKHVIDELEQMIADAYQKGDMEAVNKFLEKRQIQDALKKRLARNRVIIT